jgi:hypothetical protein
MRLLRGVSSKILPCGCVVGIYETYDNGVVSIIDVCGSACSVPTHHLHEPVALDAVAADAASVETPRDDR